jgi:hypothetical protein
MLIYLLINKNRKDHKNRIIRVPINEVFLEVNHRQNCFKAST